MQARVVIITGGVVSSLGKGLFSASLAALMEARGLKVRSLKFEPYLNVDPGTMSPYEHGEVYVLDDGSETDLDLGHYERFTRGQQLSRLNVLSSGQVYQAVIQKERQGGYLGKTVQVIPHITDYIKQHLFKAAEGVDILIAEVGGTVGDIEGLPFLEAIRQIPLEMGRENVLFIHLTLLPYLTCTGELKTKPSQQSVSRLREIGIQPDVLVCRSSQPIPEEVRRKLSLFCSVQQSAVIECADVQTSIYELPLVLHKEGLDAWVVDFFKLTSPAVQLGDWQTLVSCLKTLQFSIRVGIIGKYMQLGDAYKSIQEALIHAGIPQNCGVEIKLIDSGLLESDWTQETHSLMDSLDAMIIPGGFGERGFEGKVQAAQFARERKLPCLGICLGMQVMLVEFARHVLGLQGAHSTEMDPQTPHPVVSLMEHQKGLTAKGATMRLGRHSCQLVPGSLAHQAYGSPQAYERYRHRYQLDWEGYHSPMESNGMRFSGLDPSRKAADILEIAEHPFMMGVQFHPEFRSKLFEPHPLFSALLQAALTVQKRQFADGLLRSSPSSLQPREMEKKLALS